MSHTSKCRHGLPKFGDDKAEYQKGLRSLLQTIAKYTEKLSKSVGSKSAEKFMSNFPNLVTEQMILFLVHTGIAMLMKRDPRSKFVVQSIAEVIGRLEKKVKGYSTMKDDLMFEKDADGYKQTKESNLIRFYKKRAPCSCLEKKSKPKTDDKMGCCSFGHCLERKPLKHLLVCAGCMTACYCCNDCQRNDWENHSKVCEFVQTKKSEGTSKEDSTEYTASETASDNSNDWKTEEIGYEWAFKSTKKAQVV